MYLANVFIFKYHYSFFKFVYCSQVQIHILRHHKQQLKQHKHQQQQQHRDRVSLQRFLRLHQIVLTPLWVWLCVSLWLVFYWWLFSSCSSTFIRQGGTLHWTSEKMQATKTWRWVSVTCLLSVYTGFSDYCLITVMFLMKCSEKWIFFLINNRPSYRNMFSFCSSTSYCYCY